MMKGVSIASDQLSAVQPLQIAIYCIFQLYCRFKNMKILKFQTFYLEKWKPNVYCSFIKDLRNIDSCWVKLLNKVLSTRGRSTEIETP